MWGWGGALSRLLGPSFESHAVKMKTPKITWVGIFTTLEPSNYKLVWPYNRQSQPRYHGNQVACKMEGEHDRKFVMMNSQTLPTVDIDITIFVVIVRSSMQLLFGGFQNGYDLIAVN
jgi:hypothetical protein